MLEATKIAVEIEAWKMAKEKLERGPSRGRKLAVVEDQAETKQNIASIKTMVAELTKKLEEKQRPLGPRKCFFCGDEGHLVRECPKKRNNQGNGTLPH